MKILKSILYALGLILVITLTGIYFLPDSYSVTQAVEISRSKETVYKMVSDYNNWKTWSPWVEMDPELAITVEGEPGKAGHKMSWKGSKLGKGTLSIRMAASNGFINGELNFEKPFTSTASDKWLFDDRGNKTVVTWISEGELSYPLGRLMGLYLDETIRAQEQRGLQKLKAVCESLPDVDAIAFKEDSLPVGP